MFDMRSALVTMRPDRLRIIGPLARQEPRRHRDGVERVAQVVAENSDEPLGEAGGGLGLPAPLGLLGQLVRQELAQSGDLPEEPRVLDGQRGAIGQRLGEGHVLGAIGAPRFRHREADDPDHPAADLEGDGHE